MGCLSVDGMGALLRSTFLCCHVLGVIARGAPGFVGWDTLYQMVTRWAGSSHMLSPGVTSNASTNVSRLRST